MFRLDGKTAIVTGAGQTPGITIGNGRATAVLFARQGARVLVVDRNRASAEETCELIAAEGGDSQPWTADVADENDVQAMVAACLDAFGRIDILQNNVGIGTRDRSATRLELADWQRIMDVNLTSMFLTAKYTLPHLRQQESGCITNISSVAAIAATAMLAYKTSKAGVMALTQNLASANARFGIRANCILPGLMNTPMAVEGFSESQGKSREDVIAERDARVPLRGKMGTAWDVAHASLYLASDEANFVTGVNLPVDGGQSIRVG